jgi:heme/copper-type cytochrome/quinol oxidase subunit 3
MSTPRTLDVSELPAYDISNQSPLFLGQLLMCVIEGSMFSILIATYFYLRLGVDVWPPPGVRPPNPAVATWALLPLLASCLGSHWADKAAKKGDRGGMILGMLVNLFLAGAFVLLRTYAWRSLGFTWASDAHGGIVWAILFLHTYDFVADLIVTTVLVVILALGKTGNIVRSAVHVDSVLYYFLVGIWLPLYAVVYWGPQIVGGAR